MIARQKLRNEFRGHELQDREMQEVVPQNKNTSNLNLNPTTVEKEPRPDPNSATESSVSAGASTIQGYLLPCSETANSYFRLLNVAWPIDERLGTRWSCFTNDSQGNYDQADAHLYCERFRDAFRIYYQAIWDFIHHQRSLSDDEALQFLLLGLIGCCSAWRGKSEIKFTSLCLDHATYALSLHTSGDMEMQKTLNTLKFYQAELEGLAEGSSEPIRTTPPPEPSADAASLSTDTRSFLRSARRAKHDLALRQAATREVLAFPGAKYQFSSTMSTSTHESWHFNLGVTTFPDERENTEHFGGDDGSDGLQDDYMREQNELFWREMRQWSIDMLSDEPSYAPLPDFSILQP